MTLEEVKAAIQNKSIIHLKDDFNKWGIPTCLSDDESGFYYMYHNGSLSRGFLPLELAELG